MKIIHKHIRLIEDVIGKQECSNKGDFRLLKYIKTIHVDEGVLIYNVLTRCMVLLNLEEFKNIYKIGVLKELWFVVPSHFNDMNFCFQLKKLYKLFDKKREGINSYTIFTTTDCNAHCYYCFERGIKHISMPHKVAIDTANYIIKHSGNDKVTLWWFGGEPLFNIDAIDTLCTVLSESNIEFVSKIVSNGFLFNEELITRAKINWNLKEVQITLDGTEEIYNKTKSYIYKNINPFNVVMQNISDLLNSNVDIRLRLNVSSINQNDLLNLLDFVYEKFGNNANLIIYPHALYQNTEHNDDRTVENRNRNFTSFQNLREKIAIYGYSPALIIPDTLKINNCMADSDSSCFISPLGKIGVCRDNCDSSLIGSIYDDYFDYNVLNKYKERIPIIAECDTCCYYPDCLNLLMCPDTNTCDEFNRAEKNDKIQKQMLETYKQFIFSN